MAKQRIAAAEPEEAHMAPCPVEYQRIINGLIGGVSAAHTMALQAADGKVSPDAFIMSVGTVLQSVYNEAHTRLCALAGGEAGPDSAATAPHAPPSAQMLALYRSPANSALFEALVKAHAACAVVEKERRLAGADHEGHFLMTSELSTAIKNVWDNEMRFTERDTAGNSASGGPEE